MDQLQEIYSQNTNILTYFYFMLFYVLGLVILKVMRLIGRKILYREKKPELKVVKWLTSWACEVMYANWKNSKELINQYPKTNKLGKAIFIFPIGDTKFEVEIMVSFATKTVLISDLRCRK